MSEKKWKLLEPVKVGTMTLRNRIVVPPMENLFNNADGSVSDDLIAYYERRAKGGAGMIVVQNSHVDHQASRSAVCQLSVASHHMIPGLNRLAEAIQMHGAGAVIQIGHGGRQTSPDSVPDMRPVAPSEVPMEEGADPPRALTVTEIVEIEDAFATAAGRTQMAGFNGVEMHSAHGYLLCEFISPLTNRRTDQYGGSFENRCRFALNIIRKVRDTVGTDFTVGVRISGDEYVEGGLSREAAAQYAKVLAETGLIDYVHVSSSNYNSFPHMFPTMYYERGHLRHLAAGVKKVVDIPVISVGAYDVPVAEETLRAGDADLISMGRGTLADPDIPKKLAAGEEEDIRPCILGNEGCVTRIFGWLPIGCEVNPELGRERRWEKTEATVKKKVLVAGGGAAGMEAARTAALRGHSVVLYEKSGELGGHLIEASVPKFKSSVRDLLTWCVRQCGKGNIRVELNTEVTRATVNREKPDVLVIAVGSQFCTPEISGPEVSGPDASGCECVTGRDVLLGTADLGDEIVVVGGGIIGCETALYLVEEQGKKVVVIEALDDILAGMEAISREVLMDRLNEAGVMTRTGMKLVEIKDNGVVCSNGSKSVEIPCDTVVGCTGVYPNEEAIEALKGIVPETYVIGDAADHFKIYHAFHDAHEAVMKM
jgi:2,4-dienoyl-CoA reductase-like NADH-dependent reductase (Old Yellow Enzyme family)/thioredoxin reductase